MNANINNGTKSNNASSIGNYGVDNILYDFGNIRDLLSTIRYLMEDLDYGTGDNRNHNLHRISSLVEVTFDITERLFDSTLDNASGIRQQIAGHHA